jgi:hypothetical protein
MMIRSAAVAAGVASVLAFGGCASIVSGQNQSISVVSKNQGTELAGARCSLANDKGTWYSTTPGSVTVRRSYNDLVVDCSADGVDRGTVGVKSSTKAMAFGNILFGGVIGVGVDTVSGAAYDYPNVVTVQMGRAIDAETYAKEAASLAAAAPSTSPAPVSTRPLAREHRKQVPAATGYAIATDAASAPVRAEGKDRYLHYLTLPAPKAFVVYESGGWRFFSADADAMSKALDFCMREGRSCWLYAVDDQVVWNPDVGKRIGRSAQLVDR